MDPGHAGVERGERRGVLGAQSPDGDPAREPGRGGLGSVDVEHALPRDEPVEGGAERRQEAVGRLLTEAMGGTLVPEDMPGGGLTMVVSLPVADSVPGLRLQARSRAVD
ncbi:hypothetical protein [Streptomyces sp. NBC_01353]|uniref:hypothetical protein n=1 Tax=Streptomyces sp. NBC_01353 TaxID=2903835 RepID=UPI002E2F03FE|nr:hypothetical protein [Streptomyces sp. NBC_01353]